MTTSTPLASFHPAVTEWFEETLGTPTLAQKKAWPPIGALESTLLLAPTGSGKTLAAFLAAIDRVMTTRAKGTGTRVLYVSPMKALAMDVEKNLRAPIAGIANVAERMGIDVHVPTVDVRTGDTSQKDRLRMRKHPPDVLITTPESLYLLLTSAARETLTDVETVIVDEIHSIVPTKRGAHLFLSLERLEAIRRSKKPLQRIGLSATQKPLDEVARLLGGFVGKKPRPVTLVDANAKRPLELRVEVPDLDMATVGTVDELASGPAARGGARRSVWPKLHEELVAEIRKHRTTMIFVNSRRLAERLASALNDVAGEEIALAHHGSIAKDKRLVLEDRLKRGELKSIVATSSLELGIDIGSVDKVVQIEAPMSVASGLQRVGRANHEVGGVPAGLLVPKHRGDLLACAAAAKRMKDGAVEETFYPRNPLDVLAQQIVATLSVGPTTADALFALVRGAAPFAELPRSAFDEVLELLSGRYPSDRFVELRARVVWDRVRGTVRAKDGAVRVAVTNGGTIPDRGLFGVFLPGEGGSEFGGKRVGELEEEMVHELREGEVFLLGASSWRADRITHERVIVTPATGEPGKLPFWRGGGIGRAKAFGEAVGQLTRKVADLPDAEARKLLVEEHFTEPRATDALIAYVREQVERAGAAPTDRTIVFERYTDEIGDFRVCILSPFGGRVHAPWATAVAARIKEVHGGAVETVWTDDGIVFRLPASDTPPDPKDFFPDPEDVEPTLVRCLTGTALFASLFREAAGRALLLPKKSPHKRQPLWATRKRAADLLTVAVDYPRFPLLLETFRECLHDAFDLPGLVDVLGKVRSRKIKVATVDSRTPSPFATTLTFSFVANFIYDPDAPAAERRSQALLVDWQELRNLLGEAELRTLLDPDVVRETEDRLIGRTHAPRSPDALHDLLLRVGDLGDADLDARSTDDAPLRAWAAELERERRVVRARVAGTWTTFAAEDAAVYRDALGVALPEGLPSSFTGPRADALVELLRRHARTHGPFTKESVAARFGLGVGTVLRELEVLVRTGALAKGAFLPDGTEDEYCDAEVLRTIKQRSLARLRKEIEPVPSSAYARFLTEWSGVRSPTPGPDALRNAILQLEGCPLPASVLFEDVLPARVRGFRPSDLDALVASGEVVWSGAASRGATDGTVVLTLADHDAWLAPAEPPPVDAAAKDTAKGPKAERTTTTKDRVRDVLASRGASFFPEIVKHVGGFPAEIVDALWELVWAGEATNDTTEPLRSLLRGDTTPRDRRSRRDPGVRAFGARMRGFGGGPPGSEGRWSLRSSRWLDVPTETERRAALAESLLERYGVVTREAAHAENVPGGFARVYDVLKALEERGRVRRGYFVAERGGAQFALPGADDRLRRDRDAGGNGEPLVLSAVDPANAYGSLVPWPKLASASSGGPTTSAPSERPQRAAGAHVVLVDGDLVAWIARSGDALLTFEGPADAARPGPAIARALTNRVAAGRQRSVHLLRIDGTDAAASTLAADFLAEGFVRSGPGLFWRPRESHAGG